MDGYGDYAGIECREVSFNRDLLSKFSMEFKEGYRLLRWNEPSSLSPPPFYGWGTEAREVK